MKGGKDMKNILRILLVAALFTLAFGTAVFAGEPDIPEPHKPAYVAGN
jgi:hypothetical protein